MDDAKRGLHLLRQAGTQKINFAGGEPFIHPVMLGELCKESQNLGMAVSIISNGSLVTPEWMRLYGAYVDIFGVSVDSFDSATNAAIGRGGEANNHHIKHVLSVREMCDRNDIMFKMNTVVCTLNWTDDMCEYVRQLDPMRWKVFQCLILREENAGLPGELRDASKLVVTEHQFNAFLHRHAEFKQMVPESNDMMQNSYLMLDEYMRFLDCSGGRKTPGASILDVGVREAVAQCGFESVTFEDRGGVYEWKRQK